MAPKDAKYRAGKRVWLAEVLATNPGNMNSISWNPGGGSGEVTPSICPLISTVWHLGVPSTYTQKCTNNAIENVVLRMVRSSETCMYPALRRRRRGNYKLKASLGYTERTYLKAKEQRNRKSSSYLLCLLVVRLPIRKRSAYVLDEDMPPRRP